MGADAGFDMVPRLSQGIEDRMKWEQFLNVVKQFYAGDERVEVGPRVIYFKAGEGPSLPIEGHKFLRFSSKITGRIAAETGVENYIRKVTALAMASFGCRIRRWDELRDEFGFYRWDFVNASFKSYKLDVPTPELIPIAPGSNQGTNVDTDLYEVMKIPDRGRGLVAKVDIPKGTRIIYEKPLFTAENSGTVSVLNAPVSFALNRLTRSRRATSDVPISSSSTKR
ncbi:hypothetical protein F5B17DRAFT_409029 [Nemania serpens]|nr:hypothetical protein F5B17DRAFT_409029 [Nemania serpens]